MRGLSTRGVRPCIKHSNIQPSLALLRRTIVPPVRKALTPADAFTILLPSVLTAAFVVDVAAKQDRSQEWDRQIAVVEGETEHLRQRQLEAWSRIQRRSIRRGACQQRRMMSTAVEALRQLDDESDYAMDPLDRRHEVNDADSDVPVALIDLAYTQDHVRIQQRFERLIATRLALQFMLQIRAGRSSHYQSPIILDATHKFYDQSMDYLVKELEKVNQLLSTMKIEQVPWGVPLPPEVQQRKKELGTRMADLINNYRHNHIHLPDFVVSYVQLISEYKLGPPISNYVFMMRALAINHTNSPMAVMAEIALWESHQYLDSHAIGSILYRHGTDADSARFTELLTRLTKADSFPRPIVGWFRTNVNDLQLSVPKSRNPFLITALVRAALSSQQQTVAEAYASVFFERNKTETYKAIYRRYLVTCFLQSYGAWGSWNTGRRWLETAVSWADDFVRYGEDFLGRVVLRMLDFCVACNRREEYLLILEAAITSGVPIPMLDQSRPINLSDRLSQIRLDWIARVRDTNPNWSMNRHAKPAVADRFKSILEGRFDKGQIAPVQPFHPTETNYRDESSILTYRPFMAPSRLARAREQWVDKPYAGVTVEQRQEETQTSIDAEPFTSPFFDPASEAVSSASRTLENVYADEVRELRKALKEAEEKLRVARAAPPEEHRWVDTSVADTTPTHPPQDSSVSFAEEDEETLQTQKHAAFGS